MPNFHRFAAAVSAASLALVMPSCVSAAGQPAYAITSSIPGPDGFWDYSNWDPASSLVLVGHSTEILAIDPAKGTTRAIGAVKRAHIGLAIPGTDKVLATSGGDASVRILDLESGKELAKIAVGENPDAAIVAPDGSKAWIMDAESGDVATIDLRTESETGRIALKPGLEAGALVAPAELAINNEDESEIELVDLAAGKADGTIAIPGCTAPTGFAYAPERGLSISTCRNGKAALVDVAARKLVRLVDIGAGPDGAVYDAKRQRFIVSCGRSGTLSVVDLGAPGSAPKVSTAPSELGARTIGIDPATGRLFLPTARFGKGEPGKRPPPEPGSFHLLVMSPAA